MRRYEEAMRSSIRLYREEKSADLGVCRSRFFPLQIIIIIVMGYLKTNDILM